MDAPGTPSRLQVDLPINDDITHFVYDEHAYCAYTARGLRLDIRRAVSVQPDIPDGEDFYSYMWVDAQQGYFLLAQRFIHGRAAGWMVYREMIPHDSHGFFTAFAEELGAYIKAHPPTQ